MEEITDPEDAVCAVCARPLIRLGRRDGADLGWIHVEEQPAAREAGRPQPDHMPVPVSREDVVAEERCDFCQGARPGFVLPVAPFRVDETYNSRADWLCCGVCARLIRKDRWAQMLDRAATALAAPHGINPAEPRLREHLSRLHGLVREHQRGPVRARD